MGCLLILTAPKLAAFLFFKKKLNILCYKTGLFFIPKKMVRFYAVHLMEIYLYEVLKTEFLGAQMHIRVLACLEYGLVLMDRA